MPISKSRLKKMLMDDNSRPTRIRFNRFEGKKLPPNTILVTRPGRWGNPINWKKLNCDNPKEAKQLACDNFRLWYEMPMFQKERRDWMKAHLYLICEADYVACSCELSDPCHGDVLIELAMGEAVETSQELR